MPRETAVVILAGGKGTRMKSSVPKTLHTICGKPLVSYCVEAVEKLKLKTKIILVVSPDSMEIKEKLSAKNLSYCLQETALGTGHALQQTVPLLKEITGNVVVLCGDTPLISTEILENLIKNHQKTKAKATILTAILSQPANYGRIIRQNDETVARIVEAKDATPEELLTKEINTGIYCFNNTELLSVLPLLENNNKQKEFYLTDVISLLTKKGVKVNAEISPDEKVILGINTHLDLAEARKIIQQQILNRLMLEGVVILDPATTFIDADCQVDSETVIYPFTVIEGKTIIGKKAVIGPSTHIINSIVKDNAAVKNSTVIDCEIREEASVGPYAYLRMGCVIDKEARIGTFVEAKKTHLGQNSKAQHLSYLGDTTIGKNVNIGAGVITCNYDGRNKHQTIIEDEVFIGSNSNLIAPVKIAKGALTGAGSVVRADLPAYAIAVGVPAKIIKYKKREN